MLITHEATTQVVTVYVTSGLPPQEALVMIAEKRKTFFSF